MEKKIVWPAEVIHELTYFLKQIPQPATKSYQQVKKRWKAVYVCIIYFGLYITAWIQLLGKSVNAYKIV